MESAHSEKMIDVDLFAGAGGLAIGLHLAGFKPADLYELDSTACRTPRANIGTDKGILAGNIYETDARTVDWGQVHQPVRLVAAGVPCQPFSLGGKHLAYEDNRNLFPDFFRAIRELKPAAVMIENVKGLLRRNFAPYFEYILRQLECPIIPHPHVPPPLLAHHRRERPPHPKTNASSSPAHCAESWRCGLGRALQLRKRSASLPLGSLSAHFPLARCLRMTCMSQRRITFRKHCGASASARSPISLPFR